MGILAKYLSDLNRIISFFLDGIGPSWVALSPFIVPFLLPTYGIYLVRRNKKVFHVPGYLFMSFSFLGTLVWTFLTVHAGNYYFHPNISETLKQMPYLLVPVVFFYFGVYSVMENKIWIKISGFFLAVAGFSCFITVFFVGIP